MYYCPGLMENPLHSISEGFFIFMEIRRSIVARLYLLSIVQLSEHCNRDIGWNDSFAISGEVTSELQYYKLHISFIARAWSGCVTLGECKRKHIRVYLKRLTMAWKEQRIAMHTDLSWTFECVEFSIC